jgi:hypothetical protein
LHPEKPIAASYCVSMHDLLIEPPQLTNRGWRNAINTILNDRDVDSTNSMTFTLGSAAGVTGGGSRKIS